MTSSKKRGKFAFTDPTWEELNHLHEDHLSQQKSKSKDRIYMRDTLAKIIHDAYVVNCAFGTDWSKKQT